MERRWFDRLSPEQDRQDPDNTPLNTNSEKVKEVRNDHKDTAVRIPASEYERAESASTDVLGMPFIITCSKEQKEEEVLVRLAGEAQRFQPTHNGPEKVKGFTNDKSDTAWSPPYSNQRWDDTVTITLEGNTITTTDSGRISSSTS